MFDREYIEACRKAAEEGWLKWEPKPGDCFAYPNWRRLLPPGVAEIEYGIDYLSAYDLRENLWMRSDSHIFLPSQRQLQERLEEEGYYPGVQKCRKPDEWWAGARAKGWEEWPSDTEITIQGLGPSPELALLKALEEVEKGGEKDGATD